MGDDLRDFERYKTKRDLSFLYGHDINGLEGKMSAFAEIEVLTGTSYTPVLADNGKIKGLSNAGAIAVTLPRDLPKGFSIMISQDGAGTVSFAAGAGATLQSVGGANSIAAQYGACTAVVWSNDTAFSAVWRLLGI